MTPELCRGSVMHARFGAAANRFVYPLFFVALPLSQLERADNRWFGIDRPGLLSLRYADHGARDGSAPLPWIRAVLAREGIDTRRRRGGAAGLPARPRPRLQPRQLLVLP